jgi:hypothetical protein
LGSQELVKTVFVFIASTFFSFTSYSHAVINTSIANAPNKDFFSFNCTNIFYKLIAANIFNMLG